MDKKRILFVNEFSELSTGFSVIGKEILTRLYKTEKYDIAEYASYVDYSDPKLFNAPWKVYTATPHPNDPRINEYRQDPAGQFGKTLFEDVLLDFQPDIVIDLRDFWMCLDRKSLILNDLGRPTEIQNVKNDQIVISDDGTCNRILNIGKRQYTGKMIKIKTKILSLDTEMTENHPVLTMPRTPSCQLPTKLNCFFKNANDIQKGDYVFFPIPKWENKRSDLSNDQLFALGFFVAEGCFLKHNNIKDGIQLTGSYKEGELVKTCISSLASLCENGVIHNCQKDKKKSRSVGRIGSRSLANRLYEWFGEYAKSKFLPKWIMDLPPEQCAYFLSGLITGDGTLHFKNRTARYYTTSQDLAFQTWLLLLKCGVFSTLNKGTTVLRGARSKRFLLNISKPNFDNIVNLVINKRPSTLSHPRIIDNKIVLTVSDIEKYYVENETVYNMEVEKTNTYTGHFIMHNCEFEDKTPFRDKFKWIIMPTVDSEPQQAEWIDVYSRADKVLGYCRYSKEILERESGGRIRVEDIVRPGVNPEIYHPLDKIKCRKELGVPENSNIILKVSRNQARKLWPNLIEAFAQYIKIYKDKNTYLYLHTSFPDAGFSLDKFILNSGVSHRILMTYTCQACGYVCGDFFQSEISTCKRCSNMAMHMPNTSHGVSSEYMCKIYNCADLYIQYSIAEGLSVPMVEAKACGIPTFGVDYAAMSEQLEVEGTTKIKQNQRFYEPVIQTEQMRVYPDNDDCVQKIHEFFKSTPEQRKQWSESVKKDAIENYSFDRAAKIFEKAIDEMPIYDQKDTWMSLKPKFPPMKQNVPDIDSDAEFIDWCMDNVSGETRLKKSYYKAELLKGLATGYLNDKGFKAPLDRERCYNMFMQKAMNKRLGEMYRISRLKEKDENTVSWRLI